MMFNTIYSVFLTLSFGNMKYEAMSSGYATYIVNHGITNIVRVDFRRTVGQGQSTLCNVLLIGK